MSPAISGVEVSYISQHGLWLLLQGRELFVPFSKFHWFKDASSHPPALPRQDAVLPEAARFLELRCLIQDTCTGRTSTLI